MIYVFSTTWTEAAKLFYALWYKVAMQIEHKYTTVKGLERILYSAAFGIKMYV